MKSDTANRRAILAEEYGAALASYLERANESALGRAYEVGRSALGDESGIGLLDIALLHHESLEAAMAKTSKSGTKRSRFKAAGEFLAESLSAYEMAYRSYKEKNAALRHINDVLEEEAHRIAHLLHDEAGQSLFATQVSLLELEAKVDPSLRPNLKRVLDVLHQVGEQLRSLSHELRPTILDDLGLVPALQFLAQGISKRSQITVTINSSFSARLSASIEAVLFRVVQEALSNVVRHSSASHAEVRLEQKGQTLFCTVADDGVGFNAGGHPAGLGGGLGLLGIRERLDSFGGRLEVRSQPDRGTQLLIMIPNEV